MKTINALTIDWEYWWCNKFLGEVSEKEKEKESIIESSIQLLNLLDKYEAKATFFILGMAAEDHPEIVEEIYKRGHEIASHGYSHKSLSELGKKKFEKEIEKSLNILAEYRLKGFRAPYFSINNSTKWAFEILKKYGFEYDSSIFPTSLTYNGVPGASLNIYKPSNNDITKHNPKGKIIEFPLTCLNFGINIPIAGGFSVRMLPLWFLKYGIKKVNRIRPVILYIHPWEISKKTPKLNILSNPSRIMTYLGTNFILKKFEAILKEFRFRTIKEVLNQSHFSN